MYLLITSAITNPFAMMTAKAKDLPSDFASTESDGTDGMIAKESGIKIVGIDTAAFPKINVNIFVDKICAEYGDIQKEDFRIKEDKNDTAIRNFHFTGNATGQELDLAIVFDETTSMDREINALKSKIRDLTEKINASKLDARYSLVTFNGSDVITRANWTDDADSFRKTVGKLTTSGGSSDMPENSLDGIERALSFGFRQNAQKIVIVATDEPSQQKGDGKSKSAYTMDDVKMDLLRTGSMLIAVSPDFRNSIVDPNVPRSDLAKYADMRPLANESAGLWININKVDFTEILRQIQGILIGTYVIEYTSPDLTPAERRTVSITIDAQGCISEVVSGAYTSPGRALPENVPPVLASLTSDRSSPQNAGTVILWTANASDPDGDLILYRFFLNELPATDWQLSNQWPWNAFEGEFQVEVRVRDGMHAGPNESDDNRSEAFKINASATVPAATERAKEPHADSWQKTFGGSNDDSGSAVLESSDGGYVMTGHTSSYGTGGMDIWLIKTDSAGDEIRSQAFGGKSDDFATSIQKTTDGGYIIVGLTSSIGAGERDLWLIKTDASGNEQWDKTFGGSWDDGGISVQQTADGGYIATGATGSMGPSTIWLVKTDGQGNKEWDETLASEEDVGQISIGSSVLQTSDGGYIVAGDSSKGCILLIKTDAQGSKQWEKIFGGLAVDGTNFNANSRVLQTSDDGYIIESYTSSEGAGGMDLWLIRTDAAGNEIWSKTFGGKGDDFGTAIQQTYDGGYIITGHTSSYGAGGMDLWMIKTDAAGNEIWSKTFGGKGDDFGTSVQQTSDGSYIMTGRTSSYGVGGMDLWLIKTDANGSIEENRKSQTHIFDSNYRI